MRFSLGTFAAGGGPPFAGIVLGDRVGDLTGLLGEPATIRSLLEDWDRSIERLQALADELDAAELEHDLGSLRPLPPVQPCGQIFQAGANYRSHVIDLMAGAARRGDASDGITGEEAR